MPIQSRQICPLEIDAKFENVEVQFTNEGKTMATNQKEDFLKFTIDHLVFHAKSKADGILINPKLPPRFDDTANDERPASHQKWWHRPFIQTLSVEEEDRRYAERTDEWAEKGREAWAESRPKWLAAWPGGVRYEVRCLDGGAWDRSTSWGMFATLKEAIACAKSEPSWRRIG